MGSDKPGMSTGIQDWLVVGPPLWKIWKSIGMMIPNIWENKKCSKPPTRGIPSIFLFLDSEHLLPWANVIMLVQRENCCSPAAANICQGNDSMDVVPLLASDVLTYLYWMVRPWADSPAMKTMMLGFGRTVKSFYFAQISGLYILSAKRDQHGSTMINISLGPSMEGPRDLKTDVDTVDHPAATAIVATAAIAQLVQDGAPVRERSVGANNYNKIIVY